MRLQVIQSLGSGSFGTVRLVKDVAAEKLLAMKVLNRRDASKYVEAEIVNHSLLRHPHVSRAHAGYAPELVQSHA